MKLYYSPGACSLSPHIVAYEAELPLELIKVDLNNKLTETKQDFQQLNPNGYVPLLILDDGNQLTEGPAIVQYLADQAPPGLETAQVREKLRVIASVVGRSW